jgi:pyridoxal phosphate enzyme (YggS family)
MTLSDQYALVQERIAKAARAAGRQPEDVTLVAVTKSWPVEILLAAYEAGMRHLGENRAEELAEKRPSVEAALGADNGIVWHKIGDLQSRKTTAVADYADFFHALDRLKIANRLSGRLVENGRHLPVLLQINVSGEASKSGFNCTRWEDDDRQRANLIAAAEQIAALPGLEIRGLMTMAPWTAPPDEIRVVFRRTRQLAEWLATAVPQAQWTTLSMGMTDDFELAIAEGATHVRVGRALFGERR